MMHCILFSLLFLQLGFFQVLGNSTFSCNHVGRSLSYLEEATYMINKAKLHFPACPSSTQNHILRPMDCEELLRIGHEESGIYTIWPRNRILEDKPIHVYCDMSTDGGGWTVIQRRGDFGRPKDYFYNNWAIYKEGFGNIEEDFWLGNDNIYVLTNQRRSSIRFDLKALNGERKYALYNDFWIEDGNNRYKLHIQGYKGDAGDGMIDRHNGQNFSTYDADHDRNSKDCAEDHRGAWWYGSYYCTNSNLNGIYYVKGKQEGSDADEGIHWLSFRGINEGLDTTEMKIRSKNFRK